jgi:hypothetical protein
MRAHSLRRLTWIASGTLGVAAAGLAAWYALDVRKAVADPSYVQPAWAKQAVAAFMAKPANPQSALKPPVSVEQLGEIDRPEFRTDEGRRFHWLYSGPIPPPKPARVVVQPDQVVEVSPLEKLGRVRMLSFYPPDAGSQVASKSVLQWEFTSGKSIFIVPGEVFAEPGAKSGTNLTFVNVRRAPDKATKYLIDYDVDLGPGKEPRHEVYEHDTETKLDPKVEGLVRVQGGEGTASAGSPPAAAPGRSEAGVTSPVEAPVAAGPIRARDIQPKMTRVSPNQLDIDFDETTYDYFRGKDVDSVAKTVKTQVAIDPQTGKELGLRITGLDAESPADRFDVRPGDILVSIDGKPVRSRSDAINIVQGMSPETTRVTVVIDRNGRMITYNVNPQDPRTRRAARYLEDGVR